MTSQAEPSSAPPTLASDERPAPPTAPTGRTYRRNPIWPGVIGTFGLLFAFGGIVFWVSVLALSSTLGDDAAIYAVSGWSYASRALEATMHAILSIVALVGFISLLTRSHQSGPILRIWSRTESVTLLLWLLAGLLFRVFSPSGTSALTGMPSMIETIMTTMMLLMPAIVLMPWPVFVLIWMTRPKVRAHVESWGKGAAATTTSI